MWKDVFSKLRTFGLSRINSSTFSFALSPIQNASYLILQFCFEEDRFLTLCAFTVLNKRLKAPSKDVSLHVTPRPMLTLHVQPRTLCLLWNNEQYLNPII